MQRHTVLGEHWHWATSARVNISTGEHLHAGTLGSVRGKSERELCKVEQRHACGAGCIAGFSPEKDQFLRLSPPSSSGALAAKTKFLISDEHIFAIKKQKP